ncbi:MAG: hypothetical protein JKY09_06475, partial [Crocinitomicaceae bacterium]|nr:hypothetical protein [Crocinitomicaceae bacterium]
MQKTSLITDVADVKKAVINDLAPDYEENKKAIQSSGKSEREKNNELLTL